MPALSVEMKGVCTRDIDAGYQGDGEGKGLGLWEQLDQALGKKGYISIHPTGKA